MFVLKLIKQYYIITLFDIMRVSEISFCDRVGYNIRSDETKKYFLDKIDHSYGVKIISRHFEKFSPIHSISILNQNPHLVCLRSNGNPYLMFITKYNNSDVVVLIDKKVQQGYSLPRMILVHVMIGKEVGSLHDDTIIDGEMVKKEDGKWSYLVNDMIVYNGKALSDVNIVKRLNLVYGVLKNEYVYEDLSPFNIVVKKYFTYDELKTSLYEHMNNLNYTCRGLYFKPLFLKFKDILYNFDDGLIKKVKRDKMGGNFMLDTRSIHADCYTIKAITNIKSKNNSDADSNSSSDNSEVLRNDMDNVKCTDEMNVSTAQKDNTATIVTFLTRKTSLPDVYEIINSDGNVECNVCIPSMKASIFMRELFKEKSLIDRIKVQYVWNDKFERWSPKC